jgi:hypothetical protein
VIIAPMPLGKPTSPSAVMAASPQEMNTIEQARRVPDRAFTARITRIAAMRCSQERVSYAWRRTCSAAFPCRDQHPKESP